MKKIPVSRLMTRLLRFFLVTVMLVPGFNNCMEDYIGPDKSDSGEKPPIVFQSYNVQQKFLHCFRRDGVSWAYQSKSLTSRAGDVLFSSGKSDYSAWGVMAGIEVGYSQFLFGHNQGNTSYNKDFMIRRMLADGSWGDVTQSGTWGHNYETVIGFKVGTRGFLFGQDSYGDHRWFVQEVDSNGYLAAEESDHGTWSNYYQTAVPFYINGNTYLFFQTDKSDNYWFIVYVSQSGQLYDVCDGYWGHCWDAITSVQVNGKAYLVGSRDNTDETNGEWFVQQINNDGTMGPETDRGSWGDHYNHLVGYSYNGKAYIFGYLNHITAGGHWFTQEITADGKMGADTSSGNIYNDYIFFYPFNIYDPGNFRYVVGWDMTKPSLNPLNGWSSVVQLPWTSETKLSGGAAMADIDKDGTQRYDAVLSGIQNITGTDRFYYKVAWNIDNSTGNPASWSKTFYGPYCGGTQAGGGAAISDFDGNGVPDLVLMSVDDPDGPNSFWYYIGWNMRSDGQVTSWSDKFLVDGLGDKAAGGGAAIGDIDGNGKPDLVLMAVDDPQGENKFRYRIGKNLNNTGTAESWTPVIEVPVTLGTYSAGGGAALYDLDGNGKPELILMDIDSPKGPNPFWCYIGSDIDSNGNVTGWKGSGWNSATAPPSLGDITLGGGMAIKDINRNGIPDLLLMTIDNPYGND